jgi:hypothetical protein
VAALIKGEPVLDANEETNQAIAGYRDAMTYVLQLAGSPTLIEQSFIRLLHFTMLNTICPSARVSGPVPFGSRTRTDMRSTRPLTPRRSHRWRPNWSTNSTPSRPIR